MKKVNHFGYSRSSLADGSRMRVHGASLLLVLLCSVPVATIPALAVEPSSCPRPENSAEADCGYSQCLKTAWHLFNDGAVDKAREFYERALCLVPRSEDAMLGLSLVAFDSHDYASAESLCRKVLALNQDNLWAKKRLAYALFLQGKYSDADSYYSEIHEDYPDDDDARLGLAWTRVKQGRRFEASLLIANHDDGKSEELKEEIGTMPDVGASAVLSGRGYLGPSAYSHSLEYFLFGYLDYQDLATISFLFTQTYTLPKKNSGQYGRYNTILKSSNFNPKLSLHYGIVGVQLGYNWLDNGAIGYGESFAGNFLLNLDWLELDMGGAWSQLDNMQIWQASPQIVYRPANGISISLLGGWEAIEKIDSPNNWQNHFSLEGKLGLDLWNHLNLKISAWFGQRMYWVDQQMMIPVDQIDLYRFGFEAGLEWTVNKNVALILGCYGQFGTQEDNDDVKIGYVGGYLGLETNF